MLKIICIIVFGFIISMFITYFIAVRTSSLKKMSDEDILEIIDISPIDVNWWDD